jgi:hypothetical protein
VQKFGAVGVAIGTLVGAIVSVAVHLAVSMYFTRSTILIQRPRFVLVGVLRPLLCLTPSLLLYPFWRRYDIFPANPALLIAWFALTAAIALTIGLTADERRQLKSIFNRLLYWQAERT